MKKLIKENYIHGLVVFCFAIFALLFYYPLLSGKKLMQSDIVQYSGMSRQIKEYRAENDGKETYWIDNAFGGMPTYQLGAKYPADFLSPFHNIFKVLPRPAYLLFLYLFSAYILLLVLNIDWRLAVFGSFAFGLSTYLLIILQVGHNTKSMALAYMPIALAGLFLLLQKKWSLGFIISVLGLGLNIRANHYQMSYYLLIFLMIIVVAYFINALSSKHLKDFFKSIGLYATSGLIALGLNATPLLATAEYSEFSTRGGSELKFNLNGSPKDNSTGLEYDYITEYSYGIFESLSLIVPRIQGGGSRENLGTDSQLYSFLIKQGIPAGQSREFVKSVPTYWGSQPILEAPAYIGVIVFLFAVYGIFVLKGPLRGSLFFAIAISLILSWGKNLPQITDFFIDYVPFYNKFRAVSSIQVILELSFPILACLGLKNILESPIKYIGVFKKVVISILSFLCLLLLLNFFGVFNFDGPIDDLLKKAYGGDILRQIVMARSSIFNADIFRAIIISLITFIVIILFKNQKINYNLTIAVIFFILIFDLLGVSNRYLDRNLFVKPSTFDTPFIISDADKTILKDESKYRVYEPGLGLTGSRTSFFHNSIGGYHGAKPRRFEELFDFFTYKKNPGVLDMLNVKYVLYKDEDVLKPLINENALGNAWTIKSLITANSPDDVLDKFNTLNFKSEAIIESTDYSGKLVMDNNFLDAKVELIKNSPNFLTYSFNSESDQFVVFSEIFYPNGWQARIDGVNVDHYRANYILRALPVPAGNHEITFEFDPQLVKNGTRIRYGSLIMLILVYLSIVYKNKHQERF
ncbi:MAG: hypothetical protein CMC79_02205 [Flavobacteriaceae bacterium]|nr:hypothetical protein [Flavobacteriaceae bacterium]